MENYVLLRKKTRRRQTHFLNESTVSLDTRKIKIADSDSKKKIKRKRQTKSQLEYFIFGNTRRS